MVNGLILSQYSPQTDYLPHTDQKKGPLQAGSRIMQLFKKKSTSGSPRFKLTRTICIVLEVLGVGAALLILQASFSLENETVNNLERLMMSTKDTSTEETIHLIQIGANDGSLKGNDHTVRKILAHNDTHAILVEANPQIYPKLLETVQTTYKGSSRITPVNALICPESETKTFFVVDHEAIDKDFKRPPHWLKYQLSSLEKDSITGGVQLFLNKKKGKNHPKNTLPKRRLNVSHLPGLSQNTALLAQRLWMFWPLMSRALMQKFYPRRWMFQDFFRGSLCLSKRL